MIIDTGLGQITVEPDEINTLAPGDAHADAHIPARTFALPFQACLAVPLRIAMRTSTTSTSTLNWIVGDHLGSTNVVADINGNDEMEFRAISRTLYKPWGEVRYQSGTIPTNYTYTGQYSHTADFGLMYYNARWYDPSLGRFAQADSIVQRPGNPSDWDRYVYTRNNPINYIDPTGHLTESELKQLLGKDYAKLMELWKDDPYWLDVLANLQVGGILEATLMDGMELHIEMVNGELGAIAYMDGRRWNSDIRLWQGKGAYLIRNPGVSEEDALRLRDEIFNRHSQVGEIISPSFEYCPNGDCSEPLYVGAVRTVQSVDPTRATLSDYINVPIVDYSVDFGVGWAVDAYIAEAATVAGSFFWGLCVYAVDNLIFGAIATYQSPRVYGVGWTTPQDPSHPELNPSYPWSFP